MKPTDIRTIAATALALLMYLCISGGLVFYLPWLQIGVIIGIVAALAAPDPIRAMAAAAVGASAGWLLRAPYQYRTELAPSSVVAPLLGLVGVGAVTAVLIAFLARRLSKPQLQVITWMVVALIVVNAFATALIVTKAPMFGSLSLTQYLDRPPAANELVSDNHLYQRVFYLMQDGNGFYESFRRAFSETGAVNRDPGSVLSYRLPTLYLIWALLPGGLSSTIPALLTIASVASVFAFLGARSVVPAPYALVAPAALMAYLLSPATNFWVLFSEPWAVCFAVMSVACAMMSDANRASETSWKAWVIASAVAAFAAAGIRELMVFVLAAGAATSILTPRAQWRFRLATWVTGLTAFALAYGVHASQASTRLGPRITGSSWLHGGWDNLVLGVTYQTRFLGDVTWVPLVLVALGVAGAAAVRLPRERAFLLAVSIFPLALFLVSGTEASGNTGVRQNYWGAIGTPLLLMLVPLAFGWFPGLLKVTASWPEAGTKTTNRSPNRKHR